MDAVTPTGNASTQAGVLQIIYAARSVLGRIMAKPEAQNGQFAQRITEIANLLILACERERNVALASVILKQDGPYALRHAVSVAILVELALHDMGLSVAHRRPILCAALTMNISMHAFQDALVKQAGPLTMEQRQAMQSHPLLGRDMLERLGVDDQDWLSCVAQHHESPDGTGYPQHINHAELRFEARLIGLADRYCALLSRSAWRRGQSADCALFSTLGESTNPVDAKLGHLFTRTLGIYPPGTLVRLINHEIGMVKRAGQVESTPIVASLFDQNWRPLPRVLERDSAQAAFSIMETLDIHKVQAPLDLTLIWGQEAREPA